MKILHVIASLAPRYGGPSKACVEMASAAAGLGHEVSIYTTNLDGPTELDVPLGEPVVGSGVEIHYFPIQRPRFLRWSLPLAKALRAAIQNVDLVHIHSLYLFPNNIAAHYCRKYGVPYLIRPHGSLDPYLHRRHRWRKWFMELLSERRNFRHASAIHFTTEEEMILARPYIWGAPGFVVPLGVDTRDYESLPTKGTFRAEHPETRGKQIVLFLGRLSFKKGLDILVPAFARVARVRRDVHLVIAGPDDEGFGSRVRTQLTEAGIADRATFTGMLVGTDKLAAFHDANLFVLPSYTENFGISVVEAMVCGLPVVISDKVNLWREVVAGGAGKVVPCDPDRFAKAMLELLDNPESARQTGENGRAVVKDHFDWSRVARSLEQMYRSVLKERRPSERKMRDGTQFGN